METNNLSELRAKTGLSQAAFAKAMGLPKRTYENLERGQTPTRAIHLQAARMAVLDLSGQVQGNVSEGWQIVPKEPTEEMHNAARDWAVKKYGLGIGFDGSEGCYKAMLAAAPAPPLVVIDNCESAEPPICSTTSAVEDASLPIKQED